jgi:3-methyladenine DNA glycosylase AlkD
MSVKINAFISTLNRELNSIAIPENGPIMSKYMKGHFPFFGVSAAPRRAIFHGMKKQLTSELNAQEKRSFILALYQENERENHYIAIDFLNALRKEEIDVSDGKLLHTLITTHSWWDSVDAIASNYLGRYILKFPVEGADLIQEWRHSDNMWLRRSCLIHQLKYGNETDFPLLISLINQFKHEKEFFIQKAIGWSLRQYSKFQPEAVRDFLHDSNIKGLARKEAEKYLWTKY